MSKKDQETGDNTLKQIDIPKELRPIIDDPGIPEEKRKQIAEVVLGIFVGQETEFSGPIPPPELLKGYNKVVQNGAERIISMTEKQSQHRMHLENYAIKEELKQSVSGASIWIHSRNPRVIFSNNVNTSRT